MPSAAILRFRCLMARSMPLSPTWTSSGLHWTGSVGFGKGRRIWQTFVHIATLRRKHHCPPMTDPAQTRPVGVKAPHGSRTFEITWADGEKSTYPHEILRGFCPCAGCQGHSGSIKFQSGANLELREIEQVGNYALGLTWGERHNSGIDS